MEESTRKRRHFPIRIKTLLMVSVFGLFLAGIAMMYFAIITSNANKDSYKTMAKNLADTVALSIRMEDLRPVRDQVVTIYENSPNKPGREAEGTPEYEAYLAQYDVVKAMPEYQRLQNYLLSVREANEETDAVYIGYVDYANAKCIYVIYDIESADFPVGVIDDLYEEDLPITSNHALGFVPSIYKEEITGATLVTAGVPINGDDGEPLCYALVDITMETVRAKQAWQITILCISLISTVALLCLAGIVFVHFALVKPVKTLQQAALSYDVNEPEKTHEAFSRLEVKVHDEFADLSDSMKAMESDIHDKIHELTQANAALSASQKVAGKMAELANKDALTGVRNKIAFDNQVRMLNEKIESGEEVCFGIAMIDLNYLKTINDDYGHDSGDKALVKLCSIICETFAHSPVYRIGGDEFVVVLKKQDYESSQALVEQFKGKVVEQLGESKENVEEQVSAAIGYSAFVPGLDTCVDDVFKRADASMYSCKRRMKGLEP